MKAVSQLRAFVARLRFLPARRRSLDEVTEELESHVELLAARYVRSGMDPDEARLAARRQLGNTTRVREDIYTMNSIEWIDAAVYDLRYAWRLLIKNPGFSAAAVATVALGIAATTAIFSVVYSVLLKPLPYTNPERMYSAEIIVPERREQIPSLAPSVLVFLAWREAHSEFSEMATLRPWECNLTGDAEPERVGGARVSANFFSFLGVSLASGRGFHPDEEQPGNERGVVISDALWRRRYGADPTLVAEGSRSMARVMKSSASHHPHCWFQPGHSCIHRFRSPRVWTSGNRSRRPTASSRTRAGITECWCGCGRKEAWKLAGSSSKPSSTSWFGFRCQT